MEVSCPVFPTDLSAEVPKEHLALELLLVLSLLLGHRGLRRNHGEEGNDPLWGTKQRGRAKQLPLIELCTSPRQLSFHARDTRGM